MQCQIRDWFGKHDGAKQPFLLTDNGPSFVARRFTAFVRYQYSHVRIQYRTPQQLGLLERFHRAPTAEGRWSLKTEEVYWRLYDHPQHARLCLAEFRTRYSSERPRAPRLTRMLG